MGFTYDDFFLFYFMPEILCLLHTFFFYHVSATVKNGSEGRKKKFNINIRKTQMCHILRIFRSQTTGIKEV